MGEPVCHRLEAALLAQEVDRLKARAALDEAHIQRLQADLDRARADHCQLLVEYTTSLRAILKADHP